MINILKATEGNYLTQNTEIEEQNRVFVKQVAGVNATYDNWREATKEEKALWESEYRKEEELDNLIE